MSRLLTKGSDGGGGGGSDGDSLGRGPVSGTHSIELEFHSKQGSFLLFTFTPKNVRCLRLASKILSSCHC